MDMTRTEKKCSNLFRAISHDMRTSLTSIAANSMTLEGNWAILSDSEKLANVSEICKDANWLSKMMENLLSITYIRENDLIIQLNDELVEEVVSEALCKLEEYYPGRDIQAKIPNNYIFLPMDAQLIEQVIINLLENALSGSGSTMPVEILVEEGADAVSFIVRGYRFGIPEDLLDLPFDGTVLTAARTADAQKGIGLRLAACQAIMDIHRGTLKARNHSQGADFIFTLPKTAEYKEKGKINE